MAHSIFGVAQTINSANYIYFLALEKTMALGHPNAVNIFTSKSPQNIYYSAENVLVYIIFTPSP